MSRHEQRHAGERGEAGGNRGVEGSRAANIRPTADNSYVLWRYQPREGVARPTQAGTPEPRGRPAPQPTVSEDVLRDIVTFILAGVAVLMATFTGIVALSIAYQWCRDVLADLSEFLRHVTR